MAIVRVQVTDVNDNRPIFEPRRYNVTLRTDSSFQGAILRVVATDLDAGLFGQVAYRITSGNEAGVFQIDRNTGEMEVARPAFLSRSPFHQLNVTATDAAGLKSMHDAEIRITASSPGHRIASCEKPRYTITVKETVPQNSVVGGVKDGASSGKFKKEKKIFFLLSIHPFLSEENEDSRKSELERSKRIRWPARLGSKTYSTRGVSIVASRENGGDGATSTNAHVFVVGIRANAHNDHSLSFSLSFFRLRGTGGRETRVNHRRDVAISRKS